MKDVQHILVYPNPSNDGTIYLSQLPSQALRLQTVDILDLQGRRVFSQNIASEAVVSRIEHALEPGMYLLQWHATNGVNGTEKIMVIRN